MPAGCGAAEALAAAPVADAEDAVAPPAASRRPSAFALPHVPSERVGRPDDGDVATAHMSCEPRREPRERDLARRPAGAPGRPRRAAPTARVEAVVQGSGEERTRDVSKARARHLVLLLRRAVVSLPSELLLSVVAATVEHLSSKAWRRMAENALFVHVEKMDSFATEELTNLTWPPISSSALEEHWASSDEETNAPKSGALHDLFTTILKSDSLHTNQYAPLTFGPGDAVNTSLVVGGFCAGLTYPIWARFRTERIQPQRIESECWFKLQQNLMERAPTLPIGSPSLVISMGMDDCSLGWTQKQVALPEGEDKPISNCKKMLVGSGTVDALATFSTADIEKSFVSLDKKGFARSVNTALLRLVLLLFLLSVRTPSVTADETSFCGANWDDANDNCRYPCPWGHDEECRYVPSLAGGPYGCFDFTECAARAPPPAPPRPSGPASYCGATRLAAVLACDGGTPPAATVPASSGAACGPGGSACPDGEDCQRDVDCQAALRTLSAELSLVLGGITDAMPPEEETIFLATLVRQLGSALAKNSVALSSLHVMQQLPGGARNEVILIATASYRPNFDQDARSIDLVNLVTGNINGQAFMTALKLKQAAATIGSLYFRTLGGIMATGTGGTPVPTRSVS